MELTDNLSLKKPAQDDFYNVDDFNYNADVIDGAVSSLDSRAVHKTGNESISGIKTFNGEISVRAGITGINIGGQTQDANSLFQTVAGKEQVYLVKTNGETSNISNIPRNESFMLVSKTVRYLSATDKMITQTFYCHGEVSIRHCIGSRWSEWVTIPTTADIPTKVSQLENDSKFVRETRKINNKPLSADISLTASDVSALALTGGNLTGNLTNSGAYYKTIVNVDLSTTSTNGRENTPFQINRNPVDTTNTTGNIAQIHVAQNSNSQNMEVGIRVANPRGGNLPASGTNVNTVNCWDKMGLRYNYTLNRAYAYTSNAPTLNESDNRYYANHLATVGNLKDAVTSAVANYLPLAGGTMTGNVSGTTASFSGTVTLTKTTDLSGTKNNSPALIVGGTATTAHMEIDNNEIQSKADGTTVSELFLNNDGGQVYAQGTQVARLATKNTAVGNSNTPVFVNNMGVVTACTMNGSSEAGLARITAQAFGVYGSNGQSNSENNSQGFHHGYVKYASGLIFQWGCVFVSESQSLSVTFETPFVNKPQLTISYNSGGDHLKGFRQITNTGFTAWVNKDSSGGLIKWMAIGV